VVVNWAEIDRLRRTYGFDDAITPGAIDALTKVGLERVPLPQAGPSITILRVTAVEKH
jgi:hypothetical protein